NRVVYTTSKNNYLNTTDIVENKLDFAGKVLETNVSHTKGSDPAIVTTDRFTYDHAARLLKQEQTIGANTEVLMENHYDGIGQLITKETGGGLQHVDYDYNVRGWLRQINDPNNLGTDLFAFGINYNTVDHGGSVLFNGNIAETKWRTANTDNSLKWYRYSYDALNRIENAIGNNSNYDLVNVDYDPNGNITALNRKGHANSGATSFGTMDNLVYTYDSGNKLTNVADNNASDSYGFVDVNGSGTEYAYDTNGNMTRDDNKGITTIAYNHLNLPTTVTMSGGTISYIYDAAGTKLKKTAGGSVTEYVGNYVYSGTTSSTALQFFNHPEGYVYKDGSAYKYVYQYKDHLGNIRLSYEDGNDNGSVDQSEIVEENNYYPFGLKHKGYNSDTSPLGNSVANRWKYNGIELDETSGLYEMDFRQYDASLGRFTAIDPAAELAGNWTPFRFGFNNPILFNDPLGLWEKRNGSWYTSDSKDIERFLSMLQFEVDFSGGFSGAQLDTFINEEWQGTGGRLSDGSILLDGETVAIDSSGKSEGFSARQADNINQQTQKYGSNPYNEKSSGINGHWAYSYKYHRERNYYSRGGDGFSGEALTGFVYSLTSNYMSNNKFWLGRNLKFYDANWGGNGTTGGKNKFAAKWSKSLGSVGTVLGIYGAYSTYEDYQNDKLSGAGAAYIGATDVGGLRNIHGAAYSFGTSGGRAIVESDWYFNTFLSDYNW
ncbi:MAG: RHS repeat domain-containing protein, partial [Allomuricauda sp.]